MLPFIVILIAVLLNRGESKSISPKAFPWFALAFAVCLLINSSGFVPVLLSEFLSNVSQWSLVFAIAGLGVTTSLKSMMELGGRSIVLLVLQTLALLALAIIAVSTELI